MIVKKMGVILTRTLANEALLVSQKEMDRREKNTVKKKPTPKSEMTEQEKKVELERQAQLQRDQCKIIVQWIAMNIKRMRPTGIAGNNFHRRKQSHDP